MGIGHAQSNGTSVGIPMDVDGSMDYHLDVCPRLITRVDVVGLPIRPSNGVVINEPDPLHMMDVIRHKQISSAELVNGEGKSKLDEMPVSTDCCTMDRCISRTFACPQAIIVVYLLLPDYIGFYFVLLRLSMVCKQTLAIVQHVCLCFPLIVAAEVDVPRSSRSVVPLPKAVLGVSDSYCRVTCPQQNSRASS